jgi:tetratricopeptide (TPR) repeat protein
MNVRASRLAVAVLAATIGLYAATAVAQVGRYDPAERAARKQHKQEADTEAKFPNAKREAPEQQASKKGGKELNEIVALYQAKNYPETIARAEALAGSSDNAYEKSFAYQLAATAAAEAGDNAKAAADFAQALAANGLNNDQHFQVMYNLAVTQYQLGKYTEALATLDRYIAETGVDPASTAELRGSMLANLDKPDQAAALFEQSWRKDPSDTKALMNAVAMYQQAQQFDKSNALLMDAKAKGGLDADGYRGLYVGLLSAGKDKEALATIEEGVAAGKIQADDKLANAYTILAQNAYGAGDTKTAIAMYRKAAPMADDGEPALNLARVLMNEGQLAEAAQAAQQALDKGVKNPGDARKIIAKKGK